LVTGLGNSGLHQASQNQDVVALLQLCDLGASLPSDQIDILEA